MKPCRLTLARHLALYSVFHSSVANRVAHAVFVPIVMGTGIVLLTYTGPLPLVLAIGSGLTLGVLDPVGGLLLGLLYAAGYAVSAALLPVVPWYWLAPAACALHLCAWYGTVVIGHRVLEPPLDVDGAREDSNVYFRRGFYLGTDLGTELTLLDRLNQFQIAPLSVVFELLFLCGLRRDLKERVEEEASSIRDRLAKSGVAFSAEREPPLAKTRTA